MLLQEPHIVRKRKIIPSMIKKQIMTNKNLCFLLKMYPLALLWAILGRIERIIMRMIQLPNLIAQDVECLKHGDILRQF
jgi:hypothetical protein